MNPERWKQVSQLVHAALAREAGERATFLARECADDHELRQIVESLMAKQTAPGTFINELIVEVLAKLESADAVTAGAPRASGFTPRVEGRLVGAYRITREIGHGGMGSVYLATRADDVFHKDVAIKDHARRCRARAEGCAGAEVGLVGRPHLATDI